MNDNKSAMKWYESQSTICGYWGAWCAEDANLLQSQSLQTSKLHVTFKLDQEQCLESFVEWISKAKQLHPSLTSSSTMQCVGCSGVKHGTTVLWRSQIKLVCLVIWLRSLGLAVARRLVHVWHLLWQVERLVDKGLWCGVVFQELGPAP